MRIEPVENKYGKPIPKPIPFLYNHQLKTLYKKGKIKPPVDIYGDKLTKKNCTLEHLLCVCHGGKTETDNLVLATARMNSARGNKPLADFINAEGLAKYCEYFLNLKLPEFDGVKYVKGILDTINHVLDLNI